MSTLLKGYLPVSDLSSLNYSLMLCLDGRGIDRVCRATDPPHAIKIGDKSSPVCITLANGTLIATSGAFSIFWRRGWNI